MLNSDKVFILKKVAKRKVTIVCFSPELQKEVELERKVLHLLIKGGDSKAFLIKASELLILFPWAVGKDKARPLSEKESKEELRLAYAYLKDNKTLLAKRIME